MKRGLAALLTVGLMTVLVWIGSHRTTTTTQDNVANSLTPADTGLTPISSPAEQRVQMLLASAGAGDVSAYLGAFTGALKERLSRSVEERGRETFAGDLKRATQARKSHAVFAAEPDGPNAALVTVESVYPDQNERQTFRVEKTDAGWFVTGVETLKSRQPSSKYGAAAVYIAPEGRPVPAGMKVETGDEPAAPEG